MILATAGISATGAAMLDNKSWERLLDGLIRATETGKLEWQGIQAQSPFGMSLSIASLRDKRVLRAFAKSAMYSISSEGFGSAPFELTVAEKNGHEVKEVGTLRSSTMVTASDNLLINQKLESLFRMADSLAEDPSSVVDRLLDDFS